MRTTSIIKILLAANLIPLQAYAKPECEIALAGPVEGQVELADVRIDQARVISLRSPITDQRPQIFEAKLAEAASLSPVELNVQLPNGQRYNLLGTSHAAEIERRYQAEVQKGDPYATNVFFQPGVAAPFWPITNRLTGEEVEPGILETQVLGQTVRMQLNHGLQAGQRKHNLLGLSFDKRAQKIEIDVAEGTQLKAEFEPGFHGNLWTGKTKLKVSHTVRNGAYFFEMEAKNVGDTPVPMSAGAHPYFLAPSGDPEAVRVKIPARSLVEIDNYDNVLPTGRILEIEKGGNFDFNEPDGVPLAGRYFDNLFIDLEKDPEGFAYAEFIDTKAAVRVRVTALTKNVIGVQMYAPKPETKPELGVFAALELVTALPDPKEELWGNTPTGMQLVQPGETFKYGYKIELFPL